MQTITTQQLVDLIEGDPDLTVVNTLPSQYFEETRIPGAISIPETEKDFTARVEQQAGGKDQPVVVYCKNHDCRSSESGAAKLEEAGFASVMDYAGGAEAWREEAPPAGSR